MLSIPPGKYKQQICAVLSVIWSMTQAIECNELKCLFFIWHLLTVLFIALRCDFDSYKIYFIFIFQWHTYSIVCGITNSTLCWVSHGKNGFFFIFILQLKFKFPLDKSGLPMNTQIYTPLYWRWQIFHMSYVSQFITHHDDNIHSNVVPLSFDMFIHIFFFFFCCVVYIYGWSLYLRFWLCTHLWLNIMWRLRASIVLLYNMRISAGLKILFNIWLGAVNAHIYLYTYHSYYIMLCIDR